jgi:hypothetical protein
MSNGENDRAIDIPIMRNQKGAAKSWVDNGSLRFLLLLRLLLQSLLHLFLQLCKLDDLISHRRHVYTIIDSYPIDRGTLDLNLVWHIEVL